MSDEVVVLGEPIYHVGTGSTKVPVFCADAKPIDGQQALESAVQCPVKYLSKVRLAEERDDAAKKRPSIFFLSLGTAHDGHGQFLLCCRRQFGRLGRHYHVGG